MLWKSWRVRACGARSRWLVLKPKGHPVLLLQFNETLMFKVHASGCRSHKLEVAVFILLFDAWRRYAQVQCSTATARLFKFEIFACSLGSKVWAWLLHKIPNKEKRSMHSAAFGHQATRYG